MGANAQTIVPTFTASQVLTADQMNQSARTGVPVFATTTTRDAAFGGAGEKTLAEGQCCYIEAAPKRLQIYNGTSWIDFDTEYTAFTPTWTNLTVGNATQDFEYCRLGKFVHYQGTLTWGSTTSASGNISVSAPVNMDTSVVTVQIAACTLTDTGTADYQGSLYVQNTSNFFISTFNVAGTYPTHAIATATVPFTWTNTDLIRFSVFYKAA